MSDLRFYFKDLRKNDFFYIPVRDYWGRLQSYAFYKKIAPGLAIRTDIENAVVEAISDDEWVYVEAQ